MDESARKLRPDVRGIVMEVEGSSKEKECLGFMINKMSKGISLPKQREQSCQAACQRDRARWDGSLAPSPLCCFGDKTDPDLCQQLGKASLAVLCESDKNNSTRAPAAGYALDRSVFPGQEGRRRAEPGLQPADIKAALSYAPFSPLSFPVLTGNRR